MPNKFWTKILKKKKKCNREFEKKKIFVIEQAPKKKKLNINPKQIPNRPNPNVFSKKKKKRQPTKTQFEYTSASIIKW